MFNSAAGIQQIFAKPVGANGMESYELWFDGTGGVGNGKLKAAKGASNGSVVVSSGFDPVLGQWYHLAFTSMTAARSSSSL